MSDFTDDEDRQLVQLAIAFSSCGKLIQWDRLAARMARSTHSKDALRQRLKTLKRTHGKDLRKFPLWFFRKALFWDVPSRERRKSNAASSRRSSSSIEVVCRSHRAKKRRNYGDGWCWNVLPCLPLRQYASRPDAVAELPIVPNALPDCDLSPNTRMCDCYEDGTKRSSLELLADVAAQRCISLSFSSSNDEHFGFHPPDTLKKKGKAVARVSSMSSYLPPPQSTEPSNQVGIPTRNVIQPQTEKEGHGSSTDDRVRWPINRLSYEELKPHGITAVEKLFVARDDTPVLMEWVLLHKSGKFHRRLFVVSAFRLWMLQYKKPFKTQLVCYKELQLMYIQKINVMRRGSSSSSSSAQATSIQLFIS